MTRTDIHAPSSPSFDPEKYALTQIVDLYETKGEWPSTDQIFNSLSDLGAYDWADHQNFGNCGHCGQHIRYAGVLTHKDGETILAGEDCLDNRFSGSLWQFKQLRKNAAAKSAATKAAKAASTFVADNGLEELVTGDFDNSFLNDLKWKLKKYGDLSPKQVAAAKRVIKQEAEKADRIAKQEAEKAALIGSGVATPIGKKIVVNGKIISLKWSEDYGYGSVLKWVIVTDEGWKVWGSVPKAAQEGWNYQTQEKVPGAEVGDIVGFLAGEIVESRDKDPLFGVAKRPTQYKLIKKAAVLVAAAS